jgi:hypothetical protein
MLRQLLAVSSKLSALISSAFHQADLVGSAAGRKTGQSRRRLRIPFPIAKLAGGRPFGLMGS